MVVLTKAIVKKTCGAKSNYYYVYIPLLRKANDSEEDATLKATRIQVSGIKDDLNVGDAVYVSFEDDKYGKPVILGKLYSGNEEEVSSNQSLRTLNVTDKVQLPGDTIIGDMTMDSLRDYIDQGLLEVRSDPIDFSTLSSGTVVNLIGLDSENKLKKDIVKYPTRIYTTGLKISNGVGDTTCSLYLPYATVSAYGVAKLPTYYEHRVTLINNFWNFEKQPSGLFVWVEYKEMIGQVIIKNTVSTAFTFSSLVSYIGTHTASNSRKVPLLYDYEEGDTAYYGGSLVDIPNYDQVGYTIGLSFSVTTSSTGGGGISIRTDHIVQTVSATYMDFSGSIPSMQRYDFTYSWNELFGRIPEQTNMILVYDTVTTLSS